jgi:protein O-mannosyl-transferase
MDGLRSIRLWATQSIITDMSNAMQGGGARLPIRHIHILGFVEEIRHIHETMPDRRFCFVLGAGASKTSLIPTAGELGLEWLKKIHIEDGGQPDAFADWLDNADHGIEGLSKKTKMSDISVIAAAYPAIYKRKWGHDIAQGVAEIERHIEGARPSYGYYALAEILASDDLSHPSRHNIVITPNFDNLPAETLGALGKKIPLVIGHSAIAEFARPTLQRPLIVKFHHDFLLAPKSAPEEVDSMEKGYSRALSAIFRLYTPIVVGYGGNDGSLMGLLEGLPENSMPGGIYWCWRSGNPPGDRITKVVAKQQGALVEISGFDELMALLEKPFGHSFAPTKLLSRAKARVKELNAAHKRLKDKSASVVSTSPTQTASAKHEIPPAVTAASSEEYSAVLAALTPSPPSSKAAKSSDRQPIPWWTWQHRINSAQTIEQKEQLYAEALEATNNAAQLLGGYARFLNYERKDFDKAEEFYLKAISADPSSAQAIGSYALFLRNEREDFDKAQQYYLQALAIEPNNALILTNYAVLLEMHLNDVEKAQEFYAKAIVADPSDAYSRVRYANFLVNIRGDHDTAEENFLKAIAAEPNYAFALGSYAMFLTRYRKDYDKADEYYRRSLDAAPDDYFIQVSYADFLRTHRNDYDKAEQLYLAAIKNRPNDGFGLRSYAAFLKEARQDIQKAQDYYKRAEQAYAVDN